MRVILILPQKEKNLVAEWEKKESTTLLDRDNLFNLRHFLL